MTPCILRLSACFALLGSALGLRAGFRGAGPAPVEAHGRLKVEGGKILDQAGQPLRLRGVSLFSSQWGGAFYTAETVHWLVEDWNVNVVRALVGVEPDGYLTNPAAEKEKVEKVVKAAIDAGIYVIIAWNDRHADDHVEVAKSFFSDMAEKYGSHANVLFEPFSEPEMQAWTPTIKPYHEAIVPVIRQSTRNLIILGTPHWAQDVDEASKDPVKGVNLAYALHFNAAQNGQELRDQVSSALKNKVAIFSSQWAAAESTKNGTVDFSASRAWLDFLAAHSISDVNWALFDGKAHSSALQAPTLLASGWAQSELSGSGRWVRASLRGESPPPPPCELCSAAGQNCKATLCCADARMTCYEKDAYFASCQETCSAGVNPKDAVEFQTSWSCKALGGACTKSCAVAGENCRDSQCCRDRALTCFEKDDYFSTCKESCKPGLDPKDPAQFRSPWSCRSGAAGGGLAASVAFHAPRA